MSEMHKDTRSKFYRIVVKGHLDPSWADWLDVFTLKLHDDGTTVLEGGPIDTSALHSVLERLSSSNLELLSIGRSEEA